MMAGADLRLGPVLCDRLDQVLHSLAHQPAAFTIIEAAWESNPVFLQLLASHRAASMMVLAFIHASAVFGTTVA